MTPNEKKALIKFKEIKQGNTVAIAGRLRVSIRYAGDACKELWEKGYIERLVPGQFAVYKITSLGEEQVRHEGQPDEEKGTVQNEADKIEEIEEFECESCDIVGKAADTECSECGTVFEEATEEEQVVGGNIEEQSVPKEDHNKVKAKTLDQFSAPKDWSACSWEWK